MSDPEARCSGPSPGGTRRTVCRDLAILAAVSLPAFFVGLGAPPIHRTQEVRVLETAREMRASGDLLVPRFCGEPRFQKPPLAYWLALAGYEATGSVSEAAGRSYSAICGMLTVLLLYGFSTSLGRPRLGLWAGVVLATSFLFFRFARSAETDVLLGCAVAGSLVAFWMAFEGPGQRRRLWLAVAWASAAFGFLAKGPAGLTYPLVPLLVFFAFSRRWRDLARAFHPVGILAFLAIAAPWFAAVMLRESHSASVFWKEIAVATGGGTHGDKDFLFKVFFYPIYLLRDFEPWCIFLLPAIAAACRRLRVCLMDSSGSGEGKFLGFALAWAGGILLQLQLIGNKQPHYFLPAFPALAFLVAWWLESPAPPFRPFPALWWRRTFLGLAAPMLIAAPLLAFLGESLEGSGKGCREFARGARSAIGSSEVYFLGESMPAMNFYLERVIPVLGGESGSAGAIDDLLARKQYFHVMVVKTREGGLAPARPDLSGDPRFRRILEAPPGETHLELYRAER